MGLFSRKKKTKNASKSTRSRKRTQRPSPQRSQGLTPLYTNAPGHWPPIVLEKRLSEISPMNTLYVGAKVKTMSDEPGCPIDLTYLSPRVLTDEGVIEASFEVTDKRSGARFFVFLYPESQHGAEAHFTTVQRLMRASGADYLPIYYSERALRVPSSMTGPGQTGENVIRPFGADLFLKPQNEPPSGKYAALWSPADVDITTLPAFDALSRFHRHADGLESYLFAAMIRNLGLVEEECGRAALPDSFSVPVVGPEDQLLIFSASREKGICYHFPTEVTTERYLNLFWSAVARYVEQWDELSREKGLPRDTYDADGSPAAHWSVMEHMIRNQDEMRFGSQIRVIML